MAGILPDDIRWRSDKADLSSNFRRNVFRHTFPNRDQILNHSALAPFIDRAVLRDALERSDIVAAWHALALAQWLDHAFSGGTDSLVSRTRRSVADLHSVSFHNESDSTHERQPV
jgi:hypothetical protein